MHGLTSEEMDGLFLVRNECTYIYIPNVISYNFLLWAQSFNHEMDHRSLMCLLVVRFMIK
jgi:hypothetical protein